MKSKYKKLEAIYDRIPAIECKGLCTDSCTIAPAAKIEIRRAKEVSPGCKLFSQSDVMNKLDNILESGIPICTALKNGRCSIYKFRPAICRIYGVAEGLECPFGCIPKKYLTKDEVNSIMEEIGKL